MSYEISEMYKMFFAKLLVAANKFYVCAKQTVFIKTLLAGPYYF